MKSFDMKDMANSLGSVPRQFFEKCTHRLVLPKQHRINIIESLIDQEALTSLLVDKERWDFFTKDFDDMVKSPVLLERIFSQLLPLTTVKTGANMLTALHVTTIVRKEAEKITTLDEFAIFAYTGLLVQLLSTFGLADKNTSYQHLRENPASSAISLDNLLNILVADDIENALLDATQTARNSIDFKTGDLIAPVRLQEAVAAGLRAFAHKFSLIHVRRMGYNRVLSNVRMYLLDPSSDILMQGYGEALNSEEFKWLTSNASIVRIALKNASKENLLMLNADFREYASKIVRTLGQSQRVKVINDPQHELFVKRSRGIGVASELVSIIGTTIGLGNLRPVVVARDIFSSQDLYNVHFGYEKHLSPLPELRVDLIKDIITHSFNIDQFNVSNLGTSHTLFIDFSNVKLRDKIDVALMMAPFGVFTDDKQMAYQFVWKINLSNTIFSEQLSNITKSLVVNDVDLVLAAMVHANGNDLELDSAYLSEDVPLKRNSFYGVWRVDSIDLDDIEINIPSINGANTKLGSLNYKIVDDLLLPEHTSLLVGTAWKAVKEELYTSLEKHLDANQDVATQAFKTALAYRLRDWLRNDLALASLHSRLIQRAAQYYVTSTNGEVSISDVLYNSGLTTALGLQLAYELIDILGGGNRAGFASKLVDASIIATFYNTK